MKSLYQRPQTLIITGRSSPKADSFWRCVIQAPDGANMTLRRYELSDFEWSIIEPLCRTSRAACRVRTIASAQRIYSVAHRFSGRNSERSASTTCYNRFVAGPGSLWIGYSKRFRSLRCRFADDRQFLDLVTSMRQRQKGLKKLIRPRLAGVRCMGAPTTTTKIMRSSTQLPIRQADGRKAHGRARPLTKAQFSPASHC